MYCLSNVWQGIYWNGCTYVYIFKIREHPRPQIGMYESLGGHGRSLVEEELEEHRHKNDYKIHLGTLFGASLYDCLDDIQGPLT